MIGQLEYGFTRTFEELSLEEARQRVEAALKEQGFGILTEIDVRATFRAKLGLDFPSYTILGACNPSLAHKAIVTDPGVGLLLPCNVVIAEGVEGGAVVAIMDPERLMDVVPDPSRFEEPMREARERLQRALADA